MLLTVSFVVCLVYGIRKIFRRHQVSKASRRFDGGLADGPCLAPIEQDWEDVGPIEVHLSVCEYVGSTQDPKKAGKSPRFFGKRFLDFYRAMLRRARLCHSTSSV